MVDLPHRGRVALLGDAAHLREHVAMKVPQVSDWNMQSQRLEHASGSCCPISDDVRSSAQGWARSWRTTRTISDAAHGRPILGMALPTPDQIVVETVDVADPRSAGSRPNAALAVCRRVAVKTGVREGPSAGINTEVGPAGRLFDRRGLGALRRRRPHLHGRAVGLDHDPRARAVLGSHLLERYALEPKEVIAFGRSVLLLRSETVEQRSNLAALCEPCAEHSPALGRRLWTLRDTPRAGEGRLRGRPRPGSRRTQDHAARQARASAVPATCDTASDRRQAGRTRSA